MEEKCQKLGYKSDSNMAPDCRLLDLLGSQTVNRQIQHTWEVCRQASVSGQRRGSKLC